MHLSVPSMEEEDKHCHFQPLIPHSLHQHDNNAKYSTSDGNNVVLGILTILFVALISLWANHEASKSFHVTTLNDANDSPAGRRFALSYVSNDKANRILLNTSSFVETFLYKNNNNNNNMRKHIHSVTLRLTHRSFNTTVSVYAADNRHHGNEKSFNGYVIEISPILLEDKRYDEIAIVGAILRGMARVWMWDDGAPQGLVDGMAEYVAEMAGFRREEPTGGVERPECEKGRGGAWWWEDKDPTHVARLLHYCEKYKKGFIQRLNEAMMDTWHDRVADEILGLPVMELCALFHNDNNASWVGSIFM
ncbi:hypothetical protein VNO78_27498 [Psophocarpus tetragonolobus]|uniref:Uncharacterized protein n=1 Tax=Psophocarpus tetragonolobus TaxID=3891 RepID=A0AAN9XAM6_PSOTE